MTELPTEEEAAFVDHGNQHLIEFISEEKYLVCALIFNKNDADSLILESEGEINDGRELSKSEWEEVVALFHRCEPSEDSWGNLHECVTSVV